MSISRGFLVYFSRNSINEEPIIDFHPASKFSFLSSGTVSPGNDSNPE